MGDEKFQKGRLTIGVLINQMDGRYQSLIRTGLEQAAKDKDVNILFFIGKSIHSPFPVDYNYNMVYQLLNQDRFDGLIIASGSLCNYADSTDIKKYLEFYRPLPAVSLSIAVDGVPSILTDNRTGMLECLHHLYDFHGYRRIGFLTGPATNPEALERYQAYMDFAEEVKLVDAESLILKGDFGYHSGIDVAQQLLKGRIADFEAIACANDDMAFAMYRVFQANGVRMPDDIALVGFDDIQEIQYISPPMTTVHQPLVDEGYHAMLTVIDMIQGKEVKAVQTFPTRLVVRESCGCFQLAKSGGLNGISMQTDRTVSETSPKTFNKEFTRVSMEGMVEYLLKRINEKDTDKKNKLRLYLLGLVSSLTEDLNRGNERSVFILVINDILTKQDPGEIDSYFWQDILLIMRHQLFSMLGYSVMMTHADEIFQRAQILIGRVASREKALERIALDHLIWQLRNFTGSVNIPHTVQKLLEFLTQSLKQVGITACYIVLYKNVVEFSEGLNEVQYPHQAELVMAYDEEGVIVRSGKGRLFFTSQLLPEIAISQKKRHQLVVQSLFSREKQLGYIIFEIREWGISIFEALRDQISNSIQTSYIFKEKEETGKRLETALKDLQLNDARLEQTAKFFPSIIIETDMDQKIEYINPTGLEIFQIPKNYANRTLKLEDLIAPSERGNFEHYQRKLYQGEFENINEYCFQTFEKKEISLFCKAELISENGRIEGVRWSMIDLKPLLSSLVKPEEIFFRNFNFSPREKDVLGLILQGFRAKEIADSLKISPGTVKDHTRSIYRKIGVGNKSELFEYLKKNHISQFGHQSYILSLLGDLARSKMV